MTRRPDSQAWSHRHSTAAVLVAIASLLALATAGTATAVTLDLKGQWSAKCSGGRPTTHTFDRPGNKATYNFKGPCVESQGTWVVNRRYTITANWNGQKKQGTEAISVQFQSGPGTVNGSTLFSCPADPWLHDVTCTVLGKGGQIFDYFQPQKYPISATFLDAADRQALKTAWDQEPLFVAPQAPVIVLPAPGQAFSIPATVAISIKHNLNYSVNLEFQHRPNPTKPKSPPTMWTTHSNIVCDLKSNAGVSVGSVTLAEAGKWRVRAQSNFMNAPWSDWREFVVNP